MSNLHRMARDAARKELADRAQAESLYQRLAAMVGPWGRDGSESLADISRTGLRKLGMAAPDEDGEAVSAMGSYLLGRSHSGNGMDGAASMFYRNVHQVSAFDSQHPTGDDFVSRHIRGGK
jgi:hypothetical protein